MAAQSTGQPERGEGGRAPAAWFLSRGAGPLINGLQDLLGCINNCGRSGPMQRRRLRGLRRLRKAFSTHFGTLARFPHAAMGQEVRVLFWDAAEGMVMVLVGGCKISLNRCAYLPVEDLT